MFCLYIMFLMVFFITFFLFILNIFLGLFYTLLREKNSSFECGFETMESTRLPFSIQFYVISLLFLIFDVEIVYLFPMMVSLKFLSYKMWLMYSLLILIILFLGLEYEKSEGLLKWYI